jgi:hypothetical protein
MDKPKWKRMEKQIRKERLGFELLLAPLLIRAGSDR